MKEEKEDAGKVIQTAEKSSGDPQKDNSFPELTLDLEDICKNPALVREIIAISRTSSGPLPPPEILVQYNEIIPDGAERIMQMAERQQAHRHNMEKHVIFEEVKQSGRGQIFGLVISLVTVISATSCIYLGHEWPGAILGVGGLTGLVALFLQGRKNQSPDSEDKTELNGLQNST